LDGGQVVTHSHGPTRNPRSSRTGRDRRTAASCGREPVLARRDVGDQTAAMQLSDLRIFVEPQQGASYDTLLAVARRSEALDFGAFFRSDHYLGMGDHDGLPGPADAWVTLAGLARETDTIRLGTLVSPVTF